MGDHEEVRLVAAAPDRGGGPGRGMLVTIGVVAALIVGLLVGRLTAPGDDDPPSRSPVPSSGAEVGPARSVDGVPVGYDRSEPGAVAAATNYVAVLSSPLILDGEQREAAVRQMATEEFAPTFLAQTTAANRQLQSGPLGTGLRQGDATIFQGVQLGYRVNDYADQQATVTVWTLAMIANVGAVAPQAGWQTNIFELAWEGGDWRLAAYRGRPGPTPALPQGTELTEGPEFVDEVGDLQAYRNVP